MTELAPESHRPESPTKHPAVYSTQVLDAIAHHIEPEWFVLDPFAGTGKVHELECQTVGVEIEPEWAEMHEDTICGSALDLPFVDSLFDAVVTSPVFGNRMSDWHVRKEGSTRRSYGYSLGRKPSEESSGTLQWGRTYKTGNEYREFHRKAWREVARVLKPGGTFILNISDHVRDKQIQPVSIWHAQYLGQLGFDLVAWESIQSRRFKLGSDETRNARVPNEWVLVFRLSTFAGVGGEVEGGAAS